MKWILPLLIALGLAGCSRGPEFLGLRVGDRVFCKADATPFVITKLASGPLRVASIDEQQIVLVDDDRGGMQLSIATKNLAGVVTLP